MEKKQKLTTLSDTHNFNLSIIANIYNGEAIHLIHTHTWITIYMFNDLDLPNLLFKSDSIYPRLY